MAALALTAETAIVHVVLEMAIHARLADPGRPAILVAVVTGHFGMATIQNKFRRVVIEVPGFPGARVVTHLALDAEAALVLVIFLMTSIAGRWRIMEGRSLMAFFALCPCMATGQRKARLVVIVRGILPALFVVTTFALVA